MRIFLRILGAVALLVAGLVAAGFMLPREHRATSLAVLPAPPDSVWDVIRDLERVPSWWPEVTSAARLPDKNGEQRFQQTFDDFTMTLVVKESVRPSRLRTEIDAPAGSPFGGSWIYELARADGGTEVRLTEDGWIANPLFRVITRITGYHRTLDHYLTALGPRFGAEVRVEHVR
jgi:uncharacterized protein YndB with AHSA1/START domain